MVPRKMIFSIALLILIPLAFGAGYFIGSKKNTPYESIHTLWVKTEEPPVPGINIDGAEIPLVRSGYSWSAALGGGKGKSVSADSAPPRINDMTLTTVQRGALIRTRAPQRIKEFTLANTTLSGSDPYSVPASPGIYLYRIHCEWLLDQGQADYYFAVEVK